MCPLLDGPSRSRYDGTNKIDRQRRGSDSMKVCILMGSPRKQGNTNALLGPFRQELEGLGAETETVWLHALEIRPCTACRACQRDWTAFGCVQRDDVPTIFDKVLACDLIVLATPIYSWYCTPPMKALLDRLVYGMDKYYGAEKGPALWAGKALALLLTCGYRPERAVREMQNALPAPYGKDINKKFLRQACRECYQVLRQYKGLEIINVTAQDGTYVSVRL